MKKIIAISFILITLTACSDSGAGDISSDIGHYSSAAPESTAEAAPARDRNAEYDYEVTEIRCNNGSKSIYGKAYIPKGREKFPLIIASHGMGTNHESGTRFAEIYASKGFAAYTFDFCGGSNRLNENLSDGGPMEVSAKTEASDLSAVIDSAKKWDFVDAGHIFLQGGSMGGLVSTMVGLERPDDTAGLILLYPALTMPDVLTKWYSRDDIPEKIDITGNYTVSDRFIKDLYGLDMMSEIRNYKKNVQIVHGAEDDTVPVSVSEEAVKLFPNAKLHIIEGAGHGFSDEETQEAAQYTLDYLYENT